MVFVVAVADLMNLLEKEKFDQKIMNISQLFLSVFFLFFLGSKGKKEAVNYCIQLHQRWEEEEIDCLRGKFCHPDSLRLVGIIGMMLKCLKPSDFGPQTVFIEACY